MPEQNTQEKMNIELDRTLSFLTTKDIVLQNRRVVVKKEPYVREVWSVPAGTRIYFEEVISNKLCPDYVFLVFSEGRKKFGLTARQAKESINWDSRQINDYIKDKPHFYQI